MKIKKIILIILVMCFFPMFAIADSKKEKLDQLTWPMLNAIEQRNEEKKNEYLSRIVDLGVTHMCPPEIIKKRTPKCPPIEIEVNGVKKSGRMCAISCYIYNGKRYEVGYCRQ